MYDIYVPIEMILFYIRAHTCVFGILLPATNKRTFKEENVDFIVL